MKNWYKNCYRRHLVDMHIADPKDDIDWQGDDRFNDVFFSKYSPETYVENLKLAHIEAPMIYLQSHAGHCYYPTKVGHMHSAFVGREDMIKRTVDLCHENGMHVVGYYSLIFNTYEEDRHPDWRLMTKADGTSDRQRGSRYGHCCPNNPDYRAFIEAQIKEISEYFTLDGMYYDMTYWSGICLCEHCMAKYRAEGFDDVPNKDWSNSEYKRFMFHRVRTIAEFAQFVTETSRKYMPDASVQHNFANAMSNNTLDEASSELINEQCDFTGGDIYGDSYNHSFCAKFYYEVTKNQPFEFQTVRCDSRLSAHTISKSEQNLTSAVMLTAAHHGAAFFIDAIDPIGTMDRNAFALVGRALKKMIPYEPYFSGKLIGDVAVYYSPTGRYNTHGFQFNSKTCALSATRVMIESHLPVRIIANSTTKRASDYQMILAPAIAGISDKNRADLVRFVENGGVLYISGVEDMPLLETLLGAKLNGFTKEHVVYLAPTEAGQAFFGQATREIPMQFNSSLPLISYDEADCTVLATMTLPYTHAKERKFASIHANPPGIVTDQPAMLEKNVGKGKVIWSAAPIESDERVAYKQLLRDLVMQNIGALTVTTTAPRQVELVSFRRDEDILISAIDLLCTEEMFPINRFTIRCKTDHAPISVELLGSVPSTIPFTYADGYTEFQVTNLVMFAMFRIIL